MKQFLMSLCVMILPATAAADGGQMRVGPAGPPPETHRVQNGDTLWDLAQRYFGDAYAWPKLWSFNPKVTSPHWIYPGSVLALRPGADTSKAPAAQAQQSSSLQYAQARRARAHLSNQGFISKDALHEAGTIVGSREDQMLLSPQDQIYIQFKDEDGPKSGDMLAIFRPMDENERLENEHGTLIRVLGSARVVRYNPSTRVAHATLIEALDPIERGFQVAAMPSSFQVDEGRTAAAYIEASVVAALEPRVMLSNEHVVFIDKGSEHGVRKGDRFYFIRSGDGWRDSLQMVEADETGAHYPGSAKLDHYPNEVIAEGVVADVQKESSALVLHHTRAPIEIGAKAATAVNPPRSATQ